MTTPRSKHAQVTVGRPSAALRDSLDVTVLTQALKEFNVSRTHAAMYPPEHPQIARSIERAYEYLSTLSEKTPALTLGIAKDSLIFGGECLDQKSGVFKDFSNFLSSRDIASVTFLQGLTKEEIVRFHTVLNADPEDIRNTGGILARANKADMPHVLIQAVDYRFFHLTEEDEIRRQLAKDGQLRTSDLWRDFVHHLLSGRLARDGKGIPLDSVGDVDPAELSRFINEYQLSSADVVADYERIIASQLNQFCDPESMEKLETLLRNLRPELREQFLAVTFDHVQDQAEQLLSGFSEDIVLEMLQQASKEGREISPTLMTLVHNLAGIEGAMPALADAGQLPGGADSVPAPSREQLQRLFDREQYEAYVDSEYSSTLDRLTAAMRKGKSKPADGESQTGESEAVDVLETEETDTLPQEISEALEDGLLTIRICEMLLTLLEQEAHADSDDYGVFSQKLVEYVPELLEIGELELVLRIATFFRHQAAEEADPYRTMAVEALAVLTGFSIAAKAVKAYRQFQNKKPREATMLMHALGSGCVPGLMDLFAQEDFPSTNKALHQLLLHFSKDASEEACRRLTDPRERVLRNLLAFIQSHGNAAAIPHIRPLLEHPSHWVRMDALTTLLNFGDDEGAEPLRKALHSRLPKESFRAIGLAGLYRVGAVVDDLSKMIRVTSFRRQNYRRNEEIVRALGRIADPAAVPVLEKLARRSWAIFPGEHLKVKLALYESLANYPHDQISAIVSMGLESKDFRIRNASSTLLKGNPNAAGTTLSIPEEKVAP